MTFIYLEHEADIGIAGMAETLEEAFAEGARAMFNYMVDIEKIDKRKSVDIEVEADKIDLLFVEFLNELIFKRDSEEMMFSDFEIVIKKEGNGYVLTGTATGEKMDSGKHVFKTEVKAATYSGLKYEKRKGQHYLQCVLDI